MTEERRYSDDEVAEILDRATSTSDGAPGRSLTASGQGLSLTELEAIGAEVGISADRIREAATALDFPAAAPSAHRRFMGTRIGVGRTFQLPRELTEAEWNALVVDLRDTFEAKGSIRQDGAFRQWTNGNLQVLLEPTGDGARLRLKTLKGSAYSGLVGGGALVAMGGLATIFSTGAPDTAIFAAMAVSGIAVHLASRLGLPGWAKTRQQQMEEVGARVLGRIAAAGPARLTDGE
ncbi:MAG: hypothetical protein AAF389_02960 [Gemmatimonadota bacterium]